MRRRGWLFALIVFAFAESARADVDFARALSLFGNGVVPRAMRRAGTSQVSLLAERVSDGEVPAGAVAIRDAWFALDIAEPGARELAARYPGFRFHWAPPRRLLMDRADGWVRASRLRADTGLTGRSVVVGIVDSGVDLLHPDLRRRDGSTRGRWLIDLGRPARGRQPELEAEYGCTGASECAVYSAADLDELIANSVSGDEPRDSFGHGTHVASLAAGNGLSGSPPRYVGVAPEADLVIARMGQAESGIEDADVLRAARFVFERADALGEPAVLNLSLGSDFGAHDGSSPLEQALSSFVGPDQPGHAIVVAAGNSATLFTDETAYPGPLGIHTEVHVPRHSPTKVPLLTVGTGAQTIRGTAYVWLGFREGDALSVGLDRNRGDWIAPVASGRGGTYAIGALRATVLNGVRAPDQTVRRGEPSAVIVLEGEWSANTRFDIRLEGHGTAAIWVQGNGDLDPLVGPGVLLPFAFKEGTVNVPASAPALIAVGATLNRTDWVDAAGENISFPAHGSLENAPLDTTAFFSSAGPNGRGVMKPDIVAPGANVIGAMSQLADPRRSNGAGLFASSGRCPSSSECYVIDDFHGVSSGTSMAAPIAAGAVALLFERDPTLTQDGVRALLQAGARPLEGVTFVEQQVGVGALDLEGALAVQIADSSPLLRAPSDKSWIALSEPYAHPDSAWPLVGMAELRDASGGIADGFDQRRLGLSVRGASIAEPLSRIAPGLYRFAIVSAEDSGGGSLELTLSFDGEPLVQRRLTTAVDRGAATGLVTPSGGCGFAPRRSAGSAWLALVSLVGLAVLRRRSKAAS